MQGDMFIQLRGGSLESS